MFLSKKVTNHCTTSIGKNHLLVKFYPFFVQLPIVRQKLVILEDNLKHEINLKKRVWTDLGQNRQNWRSQNYSIHMNGMGGDRLRGLYRVKHFLTLKPHQSSQQYLHLLIYLTSSSILQIHSLCVLKIHLNAKKEVFCSIN